MAKHNVTLWPSAKIIQVDSKTNLRQAMLDEGLFVDSNCGGFAVCGKCIVKIIKGGENLSPMGFKEQQILGNVFHITKERLSCQTYVTGSVTVDRSHHDELAPAKSPEIHRKKKEEVVLAAEELAKTMAATEAALKAKAEAPVRLGEKKIMGGNKRPRPFKT